MSQLLTEEIEAAVLDLEDMSLQEGSVVLKPGDLSRGLTVHGAGED